MFKAPRLLFVVGWIPQTCLRPQVFFPLPETHLAVSFLADPAFCIALFFLLVFLATKKEVSKKTYGTSYGVPFLFKSLRLQVPYLVSESKGQSAWSALAHRIGFCIGSWLCFHVLQ